MTNNWLFQQLQKWTPFSVAVIIVILSMVFILIWDNIHGLSVPLWVTALLSVFGSLMGATGLISHGVTIANGVAKSTASETVKAVSENMTVSNKDVVTS